MRARDNPNIVLQHQHRASCEKFEGLDQTLERPGHDVGACNYPQLSTRTAAR
jgi:hypothetical protein